ncbi:UNKNOWN [Stylonychia lemnae]|uniref:Serine aminopeptidase S33 domain-containing protein n=1 Tax=Stylonychia lemnae TaxID=5949 RepID=A0A078B527_STYLE|nr:UNKNOWN [Stylonychia lemnae]|eukprot:CDW89524.1 UNKNOWN [Stylonychia lemnae]
MDNKHKQASYLVNNERKDNNQDSYLIKFLRNIPQEFPVQNPIDLTEKIRKTEFKLHTVEYPNEGQLQGVIFVLQEYGGYCDFYGHYFKDLANQGRRGDSGPNLMDDQWRFIDKIVEKFELQEVNKYLFGLSFGGLICMRMLQIRPSFFNGAILHAPQLANHESNHIGKRCCCYRNKYLPAKSTNQEYDEFANFVKANRNLMIMQIQYNMANYVLNLQDLYSKEIDKIPNIPIFLSIAGKDLVVSNGHINEVSKQLKHPQNMFVTYEDQLHSSFYFDGFYQQLMKDIHDWLVDINIQN